MAAILDFNMAAEKPCFSVAQKSVQLEIYTSFQMRRNPTVGHCEILENFLNLSAISNSKMAATIKKYSSLLLDQTFFFVRYYIRTWARV